MEPILQVQHLTHTYSVGTPFQRSAVEDMSFDVYDGEFLGIIGHTGSGKSTLIQHLNGLLRPTSGQILLHGKDIWAEPKKIRDVRFQVGLVFQYPEYQLFEETVYKDIAFGPINQGKTGEELDRCVREAARLVGIRDDQLDKSPFELSGGQKRRVALAGVMAMDPQVLVLDEPTAGLDPAGRENLMANIRDYHRNKKRTIILVSHSMDEIARNVDRILVLKSAHVLMSGTPAEVFARAEELLSAGLDVPQVTRIAMRLREQGLAIDLRSTPWRPGAGAAGAEKGGDGMLKDITLGQFFPGNTVAHRLDPRTKILLVVLYIVALFCAKSLLAYGILAAVLAVCVRISRVGIKSLVRGLKPVVFIIVFTGILNLFFTPGEHILAELGFLRISAEGLQNAVFIVLRIMLLIMGTFLMTYTTSPISLTDGLERLLGGLKKIHVPVHELAMIMSIALRFIPTLIEETDKIMSAQKARGADFESGNIIQKAKALIPILVPLFISAFRRADELAVAMECRCYHGGEGRTKLHVLQYEGRDYLALALGLAVTAGIIVLRQFT